MFEPRQPYYVHTPIGVGIVMFVTDYGWNENMVWTVALEETGEIRHFQTTQISLYKNDTWDFNVKKQSPVAQKKKNHASRNKKIG